MIGITGEVVQNRRIRFSARGSKIAEVLRFMRANNLGTDALDDEEADTEFSKAYWDRRRAGWSSSAGSTPVRAAR